MRSISYVCFQQLLLEYQGYNHAFAFFGVLSWIIDASLDTFLLNGSSFRDILIPDISAHETYLRFSVVFIFLLFGISVSVLSSKPREMDVVEDEKRFHRIMDALPMIVLFLDVRGNISCANKRIFELTGYDEAQISHSKWLDHFFPENSIYDEVHSYWDQFVSGEIDYVTNFESPIICADGSRRLILWNAVSFMDESNRFSGILVSGEDITDMSAARKALLLDELRLEALVELNQLSNSTKKEILDFSLEKVVQLTESKLGHVGFVNEAEATITMHSWSKKTGEVHEVKSASIGYDVGDAEKMGLWDMIMKQHKPIISNNYPHDSPFKDAFSSSHLKIHNYLCMPIIDSGKVVMVASVGNKDGDYESSDVRQMKLLMEGTWKLIQRRESEEKIRLYAKELAENNKELESLDRMKDEFMANITHELKTPLIPIKGYSELLFEGHLGPMDDNQRKSAGIILQNAERLHKLIDSLLYMQNINSGNVQYHLDSIDITSVLDNVIDEMLSFKDNTVPYLKKEYPSNLPFICGNATYLEQVFSHILENAFKFTSQEGSVTVFAFQEKRNVHVIVKDTGIGISKDEMPHIFKRFYQVDGSLTRRYGGNGLGLYLCKSVVEAHGGSIWAMSDLGKGTELHILLPYIEE